MGAIFSYSLYSGIILLSLYLCYKWVMSGENQHRFNRLALWVIYTVALLAMPVTILVRALTPVPEPVGVEIDIDGIMMAFDTSDADAGQPLYLSVILGAYVLGVAAALIHTVCVGMRLRRVIAAGEKSRVGDYVLVLIDDESIAPFSWCRFIVMSRRDWEENGKMIAIHESQHLRLCHWLDLLLAQCVAVLQWYNPAAWLMREELKAVHEYQADSAVLEAGVNAREYQMLLIKKAVGARFPSLANSLNHSKLKKRITMMYNSKSSRLRRMCGLALVPACAAALLVINIPAVAALLADTSSATMFAAGDKSDPQTAPLLDSVIETAPTAIVQGGQPLQAEEIVVVGYGTARKDSEKSESTQQSSTGIKGTASFIPTAAESSAVGDDSKVYDVVEEKPQFPGGEAAMMKFIAMNVRYPQEAWKTGAQGRVVAQFVVTKTGAVGDVKVIRGIDPALDKEAVRVIKSLPAFTPGKVNGKPVAVWYTIPISFKLTGNGVKKAQADTIRLDAPKVSKGPEPTLIVDGVEVPYNTLSEINPKTIERIDVHKDNGAGTISITLKKGDDSSEK